MTHIDEKSTKNNSVAKLEATESRPRKRVSIANSVGSKGPLWLPENLIPGYRLRWVGLTKSHPYKLHQYMEIGYSPLTEDMKTKLYGLIPKGFMCQTETESGSWITKISGETTHYLMCIPLEDATEIAAEKRQMQKDKESRRANAPMEGGVLTSADLSVGSNDVKTWN